MKVSAKKPTVYDVVIDLDSREAEILAAAVMSIKWGEQSDEVADFFDDLYNAISRELGGGIELKLVKAAK